MATLFLKDKEAIISWLINHSISDYALKADSEYGWVIDVKRDVMLRDKKLTSIPVKFNIVGGIFDCSDNDLKILDFAPVKCYSFFAKRCKLTSLKGSPIEVWNNFSCGFNEITDLVGGPQKVEGNYHCNRNKIVSLKGSPKIIEGEFLCSDNPLTNLKYGPVEVQDDYIAIECQLDTLEYLPEKIKLNQIYLGGNPGLGSKADVQNFDELKSILEMEKKIINENKALNSAIAMVGGDKPQNIKI